MQDKTVTQLPDEVREYLEDIPKRKSNFGHGLHPMFRQWWKMLDSCTKPSHTSFAAFGLRGVTVHRDWFDFELFVLDMEDEFEIEPSKPPRLRKNYLARRNLRAGFNPKNCYWTTKAEAAQVQANTVFVDTVFGKGMTFKQIAAYLKEHEGEEFPEDMEPFVETVRGWDPLTQKQTSVKVPIRFITPVRYDELRRRHRLGLPLLAPIQPRGRLREELVDIAMDMIAASDDNPNV